MLASVGTMFRSPVGLGRGNGTAAKVAMKGNKAYHVEVTVNEREPEDMALRRFRRLCGAAKVVYEVRRRRMFENRQDIKKRKMKERGLFKRVPDPDSWTDTKGTMEPSPFGDLFGEPQDIFASETPFKAQP